jgi:hypothetical protein
MFAERNKGETTMKKNSRVQLTPEEFKQASDALYRVWDQVASDALVDENGRPDEKMTMRRSEVFEIAMDANRPSSIGGLSRELEAKLYALSPAAQRRLMKAAFPYERYGY